MDPDAIYAYQLHLQQLEDMLFLENFDFLFDQYAKKESLPQIAFMITCDRIFGE